MFHNSLIKSGYPLLKPEYMFLNLVTSDLVSLLILNKVMSAPVGLTSCLCTSASSFESRPPSIVLARSFVRVLGAQQSHVRHTLDNGPADTDRCTLEKYISFSVQKKTANHKCCLPSKSTNEKPVSNQASLTIIRRKMSFSLMIKIPTIGHHCTYQSYLQYVKLYGKWKK